MLVPSGAWVVREMSKMVGAQEERDDATATQDRRYTHNQKKSRKNSFVEQAAEF
jgi:hypothetical protein